MQPVDFDVDSPAWAALRGKAVTCTDSDVAQSLAVVFTVGDDMNLLPQALESVQNQSCGRPEEIVIVNDSSHRHSSETWKKLSLPEDIPVIDTGGGLGTYVARNIGLSQIDSRFVAFHDADDWSHPDRFLVQLQLLKATGAAIVRGKHLRVDMRSRPRLENNGRFIGAAPVSAVFATWIFDVVGPFLPVLSRGDVEFLTRVENLLGSDRIELQDIILMLCRYSKNSNSRQFSDIDIARFKDRFHRWHSSPNLRQEPGAWELSWIPEPLQSPIVRP